MIRICFSILATICILFAHGQQYTLTHDGLTRTYRLHLPVDYNPELAYPLVINMHGLGSNAFEQEFYSEFNQVADSFGLIVTYPNGIDETWNVSSSAGTDDVGFISALIDTIDLQYNLDLQRIYATGMSMGGFMSYRLACELSDRITAIASVTGLQAFYPCNPGRPVPVSQFHGTADPVVPYAGVATTITNWVTYNNCPPEPVITDLPDIDTTDNSTVTVSYYGPCDDSSEVVLYTIFNGEHTWPGASYIIGVTNQDIEASVEIWNFFSQFTLQGSTGQDEDAEQNATGWIIYPNPVKNIATIELLGNVSPGFTFRIYNATGSLMVEKTRLNSVLFTIDCSQIPPGVYISELTDGAQKSYRKLIIQ